ncbi:MAG: ECF transporter S component [Marinilabiliaceae bacterium]|nr:ECF transporter S component [Marinilabiliaceae bacterium]
MQSTAIQLHTLSYSQAKTYWVAAAIVLGNVLVPQLFHSIPKGGMIFLPIYFFTLVGAYKYGWKVGFLTAIASPLINSALFGMPVAAVLPIILVKSTLLALAAGYAATYFKRVSIFIMMLVVLSYQVVGTLAEWWMVGDFYVALQDFRLGIPGLLIQMVGGFLFVKYLIGKS